MIGVSLGPFDHVGDLLERCIIVGVSIDRCSALDDSHSYIMPSLTSIEAFSNTWLNLYLSFFKWSALVASDRLPLIRQSAVKLHLSSYLDDLLLYSIFIMRLAV